MREAGVNGGAAAAAAATDDGGTGTGTCTGGGTKELEAATLLFAESTREVGVGII